MSNVVQSFLPRDSDVSEVMGAAFDYAWESLRSSGRRLSAQRACDARIHLARVILDRVRRGERDPVVLGGLALASLEAPEAITTRIRPEL